MTMQVDIPRATDNEIWFRFLFPGNKTTFEFCFTVPNLSDLNGVVDGVPGVYQEGPGKPKITIQDKGSAGKEIGFIIPNRHGNEMHCFTPFDDNFQLRLKNALGLA